MQTINLDLSKKNIIPLLHAKQGDVGKKFKAIITEAGEPYDFAGAVFSVWYTGPSGEGNYTHIGENSAFSISGNTVTVELIAQMLTNVGDGTLCLVMNTAEGGQIGTWNIPYHVECVPGSESEEAQQYYTAFQRAVADLPYPDASLSVAGKAADAAAAGEALASKANIADMETALASKANIADMETALATKAPIGYVEYSATVISNDEIDAALTAAFAAIGNAQIGVAYLDVSASGLSLSAGSWWFALHRRNGTYGFISGSTYNGTTVVYRVYANGAWAEWEWVNPPMVMGVEYRTTERYCGKAVYTAVIGGGWASQGANTYAHGLEVYTPISIHVTNNSNEVVTNGENVTSIYFNQTNILVTVAVNHGNLVFLVKYTKE